MEVSDMNMKGPMLVGPNATRILSLGARIRGFSRNRVDGGWTSRREEGHRGASTDVEQHGVEGYGGGCGIRRVVLVLSPVCNDDMHHGGSIVLEHLGVTHLVRVDKHNACHVGIQ
jgi:hypothetical protein